MGVRKQGIMLFAFVYLKNEYDRVSMQETVYWCLRKRNIKAAINNTKIKSGEKTVLTADSFPIEVGLHQGSALGPIRDEFRDGLPRELLFADDLVMTAKGGRFE